MPELRVFTPEQLVPWPGLNPRRHFDPAKLQELVESVRQRGIHQPVLVHLRDELPHWIVAGERRWRAATAAAGADVPAIARVYTEDEALEIALIENLDRDDLTPIEEARGFQALLARPEMTQRKLGEKIGRTQPYISNRIRLLELPEEILALIETGKLATSVARDQLLRFLAVPEPYRSGFFAAVAEALEDITELDDAEDMILGVAMDRTRSLNANGYGKDVPVFAPRRHSKGCDCGSPEIDFGGYRGKMKRCWNVEWWNAEQKRAKADKKKREQRGTERTVERAERMGEFPVLRSDALHKRFGSPYGSDQKYVDVAKADGDFSRTRWNETAEFDPAVLDPSSLIVVRDQWRNQLSLVSTDVKAVESARKAFDHNAKVRIKAERKSRAARDLETVRSSASAEWRDTAIVVRTMLRFGHGIHLLNELARELGFRPTGRGTLDGLSAERMMDTVHVAVLRAIRHDRPEVLLAEQIIRDELAAPHREALRALIPWDPSAAVDDEEAEQDEEDLQEPEDGEASCVVCGCTDSAACDAGCSWLAVDRENGAGVCSSCAPDADQAKDLLEGAAVA